MANPFRGVRTKIRTHFAPVQRLTPLAPDASTWLSLERKARKTFVVMADPRGGLAAVDRMVAAHMTSLLNPGARSRVVHAARTTSPPCSWRISGTLCWRMPLPETPSRREIFYTEAGRMAGRIAQGTRLVVAGSILGTPRLGAYQLRTELALFPFTTWEAGAIFGMRFF